MKAEPRHFRAAAYLCTALLFALAGCQQPESVDRPLRVAVAASFAPVHHELAAAFTAAHGTRIETSIGSTGGLFAQIENGAPFDLFLAADRERPRRLEERGTAVPGSRRTYAVGRLAVYGPGIDVTAGGPRILHEHADAYLAIADPDVAPYGAAARAVLERWGVWTAMQPRIVRGVNVAQALHFVESGGAELGLVAWSLVRDRDPAHVVPLTLPAGSRVRHDLVRIRQPDPHPAATTFLAYLRSPEALARIERHGYRLPVETRRPHRERE